MLHASDISPAPYSGEDDEDWLAAALALIADEGVAGIEPAFNLVRSAGSEPHAPEAQLVLVEALFQMLEDLEGDLSDPAIHSIATTLDPETADSAATLLRLANFPDGGGSPIDLSDG